MRAPILLAALACMLAFPPQAFAQTEEAAPAPEAEVAGPPVVEPSAPYDTQLLRLSEVLGSLHYLRSLCKTEEGTRWRDAMSEIVTLEEPSPSRRSRLISRFNRGYRGLDEVYRSCTETARLAGDRYLDEAGRLTAGIVQRYGR